MQNIKFVNYQLVAETQEMAAKHHMKRQPKKAARLLAKAKENYKKAGIDYDQKRA